MWSLRKADRKPALSLEASMLKCVNIDGNCEFFFFFFFNLQKAREGHNHNLDSRTIRNEFE